MAKLIYTNAPERYSFIYEDKNEYGSKIRLDYFHSGAVYITLNDGQTDAVVELADGTHDDSDDDEHIDNLIAALELAKLYRSQRTPR